MATINQEATQ